MSAGVTIPEMIGFLMREANSIEIRQNNLVEAGLRLAPHPDMVRDKEICEAIIHLIDLVRADQVILNRLRQLAKVPAQSPPASGNRGSEVRNRVAGSGAA